MRQTCRFLAVTDTAGRLLIGWQAQNRGRFSGAFISRLTLEFASRQIVLSNARSPFSANKSSETPNWDDIGKSLIKPLPYFLSEGQ